MATLSWPGWLVIYWDKFSGTGSWTPDTVTSPSTNRGQCRITSLIETNALPRSQSATNHSFTVFSRSNVTACHQDPKRNLRAGYRAQLLQCTSCCNAFSSLSVVSCAVSALCVYSTFGHHPHPLGYLCAKFRFLCGLHCWDPAYLMPREPKLALWKSNLLPRCFTLSLYTDYRQHWAFTYCCKGTDGWVGLAYHMVTQQYSQDSYRVVTIDCY